MLDVMSCDRALKQTGKEYRTTQMLNSTPQREARLHLNRGLQQ
ncbi:hypothetical protein [Gloeocapsopsis dulcis]|nr:hypothetical protein [Gloeocapsopsis dulcis]WNN89559.1 hypothetical protein P0S91_00170 [Gloeocapsopsis dulcis]